MKILLRARHALHSHLQDKPRLFLPLARVVYSRSERVGVLGSQTQIVIEGFPRCGNTFAWIAFSSSQPAKVKIAHHLHAASQVIEAARRDIPSLVLIRDPVSAISSLLHYRPELAPETAIEDFCRFYRAIEPYRAAIVLADFNEVTTDFGAVVDKLNSYYNASFARFEHTKENVDRCFRLIEERGRQLYSGEDFARRVARPESRRAATSSGRWHELRHLQPRLARAREIYERALA